MILTKCQKRAVDNLLTKYNSNVKFVDFKAPTGSGKTFMIASFISQILLEKKHNQKIVFFLATLSSAELPKQFYEKVKKYRDNGYLSCFYEIIYKTSPSTNKIKNKDYSPSLFAESKKLIIVGKSSFTKASIFVEHGIFDQFLDQVKNENYKLVYIRDEAHHGGFINKNKQNVDIEKFENKIQKKADFVLKMTATMNPTHEQVVLSEKEIKEDNQDNQYLLKNKEKVNLSLGNERYIIKNIEFLRKAIDQFKRIKKEYKQLQDQEKIHINPAMLIQIDNKVQNNSESFDSDIKKIIDELEKAGLCWVKYFFDDKESSNLRITPSLLEISVNSSSVDVIIFKIGPATGWDIPRACMLVQLRNVNSEVLNGQTLGRIKRNPMPDLIYNKITDNYYLYSNYQKPTREMNFYTLRSKFQNEQWIHGIVDVEKKDYVFAQEKYKEEVNNFLNNERKSICNEIKYEMNEYKKQKYLFYDPETLITEGKRKLIVKKTIDDALDLKIFVLKKTKEEHKIFFQPISKLIKQKSIEQKVSSSDVFFFIILKCFFEKIKDLWIKNHEIHLNPTYSIKDNVKLEKNYKIWEDVKGWNNVNFEQQKDNYAYLNSDKQKLYCQVLDSYPENIFMKRIIECLKNFKINNKLKVWTKNHNLTSDVYFNYLDTKQGYKKRKLFLDFIFKINDHYLYVEVKSLYGDYNENKTNTIIPDVFKTYTEVAKEKVVFSIVKVDTKKHTIHSKDYENYSKISKIKKNTPTQEVLEILSKIK